MRRRVSPKWRPHPVERVREIAPLTRMWPVASVPHKRFGHLLTLAGDGRPRRTVQAVYYGLILRRHPRAAFYRAAAPYGLTVVVVEPGREEPVGYIRALEP